MNRSCLFDAKLEIQIIVNINCWLNGNISDAEVSLPGSTLFRREIIVNGDSTAIIPGQTAHYSR